MSDTDVSGQNQGPAFDASRLPGWTNEGSTAGAGAHACSRQRVQWSLPGGMVLSRVVQDERPHHLGGDDGIHAIASVMIVRVGREHPLHERCGTSGRIEPVPGPIPRGVASVGIAKRAMGTFDN